MTPPDPDEIEVTVFGRGVGESVVVHLGDGDWIIVDSFQRRGRVPVAAEYLDQLGVEDDQVRAIIVSHFDRDHYLGVDRLVRRYRAPLFITGAVDLGWFKLLRHRDPDDESLEDLAAAVAHAEDDTPDGADSNVRQVGPGRHILPGMRATVIALAPTDNVLNAAAAAVGEVLESEQLPPARDVRRAFSKDNHSSVVLDVRSCGQHVLLGADLESHRRFGWRAVLARTREGERPASTLVKVPHHGSENGRDEHLRALCVENPVLLLAPNSGSRLPRDDQLPSLVEWGSELWQAAPSSRGTTVAGTDVVLDEESIGFVRARRRAGESAWRVDAVLPGAQVIV